MRVLRELEKDVRGGHDQDMLYTHMEYSKKMKFI